MRGGGIRATLGSIVFSAELLVVFLATLVAYGLKAVPPVTAFVSGGILCVLMVAVIPVLRFRWGLICGWVLQGVIVATGIVMPQMYVIGGLFLLMWVYCMVVGTRIQKEQNRRFEAGDS
ncbi:DUF4233 domain-containing protein [Microbacterium sp. MPKO10]|uniref:DUF4233 domain-containing protein n=1 Tax=Microbacterium sp. MPKO10 TaxID=2989818 RepID=UPI0022366899|nr:DUF4233 domain-containing protein [Microbacterium sp. MPKO10]MCW4459693.1 DUF4233 domain-containing protein [Microbacterium sp. MPKO10]